MCIHTYFYIVFLYFWLGRIITDKFWVEYVEVDIVVLIGIESEAGEDGDDEFENFGM